MIQGMNTDRVSKDNPVIPSYLQLKKIPPLARQDLFKSAIERTDSDENKRLNSPGRKKSKPDVRLQATVELPPKPRTVELQGGKKIKLSQKRDSISREETDLERPADQRRREVRATSQNNTLKAHQINTQWARIVSQSIDAGFDRFNDPLRMYPGGSRLSQSDEKPLGSFKDIMNPKISVRQWPQTLDLENGFQQRQKQNSRLRYKLGPINVAPGSPHPGQAHPSGGFAAVFK